MDSPRISTSNLPGPRRRDVDVPIINNPPPSSSFIGFQMSNLSKDSSAEGQQSNKTAKSNAGAARKMTAARRTTSHPRCYIGEPDKTESKRGSISCNTSVYKCGDGSLAEKSTELTTAEKVAAAPYACKLCRRRFKRQETLQRHLGAHNDKAFLCDECNQTFSSALSLREHRAIHDGELPYECSFCLRKFRQNSCFHRHLLTHSVTLPPHECTTCGRRFSQKIYLRSHIRSHTGERPFRCLTCGKSFGHRSTLKRHQSTHTGDRPHSCQVCTAAFADLSSLRRHMAKHKPPKQTDEPEADEQQATSTSSDVSLEQIAKQPKRNEPSANAEQATSPGSIAHSPFQQRTSASANVGQIILNAEDYVRNPNFGSRGYFDWLSEFISTVTSSRLPLDDALFARVSRVHGDISEVLATPFGPLSHDKDAFLCLVNMSQRLHAIIQNHHRSIYSSSSLTGSSGQEDNEIIDVL